MSEERCKRCGGSETGDGYFIKKCLCDELDYAENPQRDDPFAEEEYSND